MNGREDLRLFFIFKDFDFEFLDFISPFLSFSGDAPFEFLTYQL